MKILLAFVPIVLLVAACSGYNRSPEDPNACAAQALIDAGYGPHLWPYGVELDPETRERILARCILPFIQEGRA